MTLEALPINPHRLERDFGIENPALRSYMNIGGVRDVGRGVYKQLADGMAESDHPVTERRPTSGQPRREAESYEC